MSQSPHIPRDYKNLPVGGSAPPKRAWAVVVARWLRVISENSGSLRPRWLAAAVVSVAALSLLASWGKAPPSENPQAAYQVAVMDLPGLPPPAAAIPDEEFGIALELAPEETWQVETVRKGDTLASVFKRLGLGPRSVHQVVTLNEHTRHLSRIYPGEELKFQLQDDGSLGALEYQLDEQTRLRLERQDGELKGRLIVDELIAQTERASGVIRDSLFLAGRNAGLSDKLIMQMAGLFGWDIDFVLDIRQGDEFHLVYEQIYRNGEYLRSGEIIAATFVNQNRTYQALRFDAGHGTEYFSPDGRNMKKAFLRAPLNFSYISSSFNPRRFHPILRRVRAHNGVDYRAPTGTPVYAAGNGTVQRAGYGKYNGNYVFIQHGNNIVTKYLHFSKRLVNKGQRVKQGQVIGYVGATGMAEAPHLHYEFLVNGVHRNPRTVDLPKAEALPGDKMQAFEQHARVLLAQLNQMQNVPLLAQATDASSTPAK